MSLLIALNIALTVGLGLFIIGAALAKNGWQTLSIVMASITAIVLFGLWAWPGWARKALFPPKVETATTVAGCVDKASLTPDGVHPVYQAGQTVKVGSQNYLCVGNPSSGEYTWAVVTEAAPPPPVDETVMTAEEVAALVKERCAQLTTSAPEADNFVYINEVEFKCESTTAPTLPNFTQQWEVPAGLWTPTLTENLVIELAVQVRPDRPWEGSVGPIEGQVYQFKTEYLDEDATTWQPGVHLYEFDLAAGWQPVFVGIQGDSPVQLCWMQEKGAQGAQLLMKTMQGNGTSALVYFTKTDKVPEGICP